MGENGIDRRDLLKGAAVAGGAIATVKTGMEIVDSNQTLPPTPEGPIAFSPQPTQPQKKEEPIATPPTSTPKPEPALFAGNKTVEKAPTQQNDIFLNFVDDEKGGHFEVTDKPDVLTVVYSPVQGSEGKIIVREKAELNAPFEAVNPSDLTVLTGVYKLGVNFPSINPKNSNVTVTTKDGRQQLGGVWFKPQKINQDPKTGKIELTAVDPVTGQPADRNIATNFVSVKARNPQPAQPASK